MMNIGSELLNPTHVNAASPTKELDYYYSVLKSIKTLELVE